MRLIKPKYTFLGHLPYDTMLDIVCKASSLCYTADVPKTQVAREDLIRRRVKSGHETVIEHVGFTVHFSVDRGITHEMVRHRLSSFTQESTRYCNYTKEKYDGHITFVMPDFVQKGLAYLEHEKNFNYVITSVQWYNGNVVFVDGQGQKFSSPDVDVLDWIRTQAGIEQAYNNAIQAGQAPQIARGLLSNAVKSDIIWTANMREWRHIFNLRAIGVTGLPHPQMLEVMLPVLEIAKLRFPVFFEDL